MFRADREMWSSATSRRESHTRADGMLPRMGMPSLLLLIASRFTRFQWTNRCIHSERWEEYQCPPSWRVCRYKMNVTSIASALNAPLEWECVCPFRRISPHESANRYQIHSRKDKNGESGAVAASPKVRRSECSFASATLSRRRLR
jgi:hypothetical protein